LALNASDDRSSLASINHCLENEVNIAVRHR